MIERLGELGTRDFIVNHKIDDYINGVFSFAKRIVLKELC